MYTYSIVERTFVAWLKSTLLLRIECQETHIYIKKTECLQNKARCSIALGRKEKALGAKRMLAKIKSLIYSRVWRGAWRGALKKYQPE